MWKLLNAELRYNWWVLAAGFVLMPIIVLAADSSLFFMLFIVALPLSQSILSIRSSEKRDRLHVLLPVPLHQIAVVRVAVVLVPILAWGVVFLLARLAAGPAGLAELRSFIILVGALLAIYSIFFLLTDVVLVSLSRARMALVLVTFLLAGSVFLSMGLWVMLSQGERPYVDIASFIDFAAAHNPFAGLWGNLLFLALSIVLAALSVLTFTRHRTFASARL
ncbi:MAG TPA: hypothetical protein VLV83_12320 [Acidobacteriota bacterium]|nr:hypothetical protein [Acidobacteriota bacterium]